MATAIASTMNTFCYKVSQRDFDNVIKIYFPYIINSLKDSIKNKQEWKDNMIEKQEKIMLSRNFLTEEAYGEQVQYDMQLEKSGQVGIIKDNLLDSNKIAKKPHAPTPRLKTESAADDSKPVVFTKKSDAEKERRRLSLYTRTLKFTDKGVERISSDKTNSSNNSSKTEKSDKHDKSDKHEHFASSRASPKSRDRNQHFEQIFKRVLSISKVQAEDSPSSEISSPNTASKFRPDPIALTEPDESSSPDLRFPKPPTFAQTTRNSKVEHPQTARNSCYTFVVSNWNNTATKTINPSSPSLFKTQSFRDSAIDSPQKMGSTVLSSKKSIDHVIYLPESQALQSKAFTTFSPRKIQSRQSHSHYLPKLKYQKTVSSKEEEISNDNLFGITTMGFLPKTPLEASMSLQNEIEENPRKTHDSLRLTKVTSSAN